LLPLHPEKVTRSARPEFPRNGYSDRCAVSDGNALIGTGADPVNAVLSLVPLDQLPPPRC
jgi:hypothetical protein